MQCFCSRFAFSAKACNEKRPCQLNIEVIPAPPRPCKNNRRCNVCSGGVHVPVAFLDFRLISMVQLEFSARQQSPKQVLDPLLSWIPFDEPSRRFKFIAVRLSAEHQLKGQRNPRFNSIQLQDEIGRVSTRAIQELT